MNRNDFSSSARHAADYDSDTSDAARARTFRLGALVAVVVLLFGVTAFFARTSHKDTDFFPSPQTAHTAVETVLNAWKDGKGYGPVSDVKPSLGVDDPSWRDHEKLLDFTILREEGGTNSPATVIVQLSVEGQKPREVRYLVTGQDPLWVQREDTASSQSGM